MKYQNSLITLFIIPALAYLSSCGQDSGTTETSPPASEKPASEPAAPAVDSSAVDQEVVITANDQMKFNIETFEVNAGETIKLVLENVGKMPKFSMGHNVVILTQGTDDKAFVESAMNSAANDYVPEGAADRIIAYTKLLGGGEKDTIIFTAPDQPGEYPYVCTFPGHYQVGMKGTMIVK